MLPIWPPYPVMEATAVDDIPVGDGWLYEPKWDGFRCLAFRDEQRVELQSKSGQPLARYFPEVVAQVLASTAPRFVVDGELVIPGQGSAPSFDDLLLRIHPADSRVQHLAQERPAVLILFDVLVDEYGGALTDELLLARRPRLEHMFRDHFAQLAGFRLSPASTDLSDVRRWFQMVGEGMDGVMAKRLDRPYASGLRDAQVKVKQERTADCVVGGFRRSARGEGVGSLLLGLYDEQGLLNHVGYTSSLPRRERAGLPGRLQPFVGGAGFTGRAPGGPSRWSDRTSDEWQPLQPQLVVEVAYDHVSGGRFRHGTRFVRWRPDKAPAQCTMEQLARFSSASPFALLESPTTEAPGREGPSAQ